VAVEGRDEEEQEEEDYDDSTTAPCLVARIDNARVVYSLLKAVHFRDRAVCVITAKGLKFTVEDAKSVQAHSYLQERSGPFLVLCRTICPSSSLTVASWLHFPPLSLTLPACSRSLPSLRTS